jgi:hypothetical protein
LADKIKELDRLYIERGVWFENEKKLIDQLESDALEKQKI